LGYIGVLETPLQTSMSASAPSLPSSPPILAPLLVIVGRPNVGKSSLFNRLTGTRRSIVTDEPGITRDRIYGTATWRNRNFEVVDTGGLVPDDKAEIPREILRQARVAIEAATRLILVVDARVGLTPLDAELARLLRKTGKPLIVAANKADTGAQEPLAAPFFALAKEVFPVSAEHGTGLDDFLDSATCDFPEMAAEPASDAAAEAPQQTIQVAIIGRPNVGKSTLLNRLIGAERAIVSSEPGTTRDAVDCVVEREGRTYRFVDTAGIRRKGKTHLHAEKLSVVMARKHLERADLALLVVDASVGVTAGDLAIAGYAEESGRSVIIVLNKWDLAIEAAREQVARENRDAETKGKSIKPAKGGARISDPTHLAVEYEKLVRERFKFLDYAPIIFLSALTGQRVKPLYDLIQRVAEARRRRISTGELNRWLAGVDLGRGTSPTARRVKIFYITQASASPPTFVLFTNQTHKLHFSFERFLENRLREQFDYIGSPIRFLQRLKEKR